MRDREQERGARRCLLASRWLLERSRPVRSARNPLLSTSSSARSSSGAKEPPSSTTPTQIVPQLGNKQAGVHAVSWEENDLRKSPESPAVQNRLSFIQLLGPRAAECGVPNPGLPVSTGGQASLGNARELCL